MLLAAGSWLPVAASPAVAVVSLPLRGNAGLLVPVSEKYGDQRRIFDDLGAAVLTNANKGTRQPWDAQRCPCHPR